MNKPTNYAELYDALVKLRMLEDEIEDKYPDLVQLRSIRNNAQTDLYEIAAEELDFVAEECDITEEYDFAWRATGPVAICQHSKKETPITTEWLFLPEHEWQRKLDERRRIEYEKRVAEQEAKDAAEREKRERALLATLLKKYPQEKP